MFNRLRKLFGEGKEQPAREVDPKAAEEWYGHKSKLMEEILGPEHDMVMHAIIPYAVGGTLDLYYFPKGVTGTAVATKELSELPNQGPSNREYSCYELAMFTRHPLNLDEAQDMKTAFGRAHSNINQVLNYLARYSAMATLNPNETCEFPADFEKVGGKCLVFDGYGSRSDEKTRCLGILAIIEVFRPEMDYAREHGGAALIAKLKEAGHYPYSDLERKPVV